MKKTMMLAAAILVITTVSWVFSAMGAEGMPDMAGMPMAMEKGPKCPMCPMMGQGMMQKSMIATSDDGVVVMACGKLMKYDKNLVLVKEVELKVDMEEMHAKMMKMMENCPMCKKMMSNPAGKEDGSTK